jgi:hypothetical protein
MMMLHARLLSATTLGPLILAGCSTDNRSCACPTVISIRAIPDSITFASSTATPQTLDVTSALAQAAITEGLNTCGSGSAAIATLTADGSAAGQNNARFIAAPDSPGRCSVKFSDGNSSQFVTITVEPYSASSATK